MWGAGGRQRWWFYEWQMASSQVTHDHGRASAQALVVAGASHWVCEVFSLSPFLCHAGCCLPWLWGAIAGPLPSVQQLGSHPLSTGITPWSKDISFVISCYIREALLALLFENADLLQLLLHPKFLFFFSVWRPITFINSLETHYQLCGREIWIWQNKPAVRAVPSLLWIPMTNLMDESLSHIS